jgi:hypothetical protein
MQIIGLLPFGARAIAVFLFFGLLYTAQGQQASAADHNLTGSGIWSTLKPAPRLNLAQVTALLGPEFDGAMICDYKFADPAGDGFYRLLVSISNSGRFCNELEVITNNGRIVQELEVWNEARISDLVLNGLKPYTLRVSQAITDYEGTRCIAIVPMYLSFSGGLFAPAIAEHEADYQAFRAKLYSTPAADACAQVVRDKIDRLLGDKTAGFSQAKAWMLSSDPSLRRKAVCVFEDIGDSASIVALRTLTKDKDDVVSLEANAALYKQ